MSDLIDTPRDRGNFEELARRADKIRRQANEIERLESRVAELEGELKRWLDNDPTRTYGDLEAAIKGDT